MSLKSKLANMRSKKQLEEAIFSSFFPATSRGENKRTEGGGTWSKNYDLFFFFVIHKKGSPVTANP